MSIEELHWEHTVRENVVLEEFWADQATGRQPEYGSRAQPVQRGQRALHVRGVPHSIRSKSTGRAAGLARRQLQLAHLVAVADVQEVQDVETEEGRIW